MSGRVKDVVGFEKLFNTQQRQMIELAYERGNGYYYKTIFPNKCNMDLVEKCIEFGKQFICPKDRFIAILKNMIKNKGTFVV